MIFAMGTDGVAFRENPAHRGRMRASHFTHEKEHRLHTLSGENVENLIGIARHWTVVESEYDFLIGQRERRRMLHGPDAGIFPWIDSEHTARSKCVGTSRTILSPRRVGGKDNQ